MPGIIKMLALRQLGGLAAVIILLTFAGNAAAAEKIFLGILEPYTDTSWEKEVESDWVRVPFFWNGKEWLKMPKTENGLAQSDVPLLYPEKVNFYAGRADKDGKQVYTPISVGSAKYNDITGIDAPSYFIKLLDPSLVNYMAQDENYCQWNNICKRPLILTTAENRVKEDHEGWQEEAELKPDEKKLVYDALKKQFATYSYCADQPQQENPPEKKWKDDSVNQIKIFRAKNQDLLIGLQLNKDLDTCQKPFEEAFVPHWFYLKKNEVNFLGKNIMPIEYADYNNDSKTEWVFGLYGGDNDGYILFTDNFKTKVVYDWSYHQAGNE